MVTWVAPDDGGSAIVSYTVYLQESDGATYSTELTYCDGSVLSETTCTLPVATLRAAPFSLDWGSSVVVKVFATNAYGDSEISLAGNGAVLTTTPDAPTDLIEVVA